MRFYLARFLGVIFGVSVGAAAYAADVGSSPHPTLSATKDAAMGQCQEQWTAYQAYIKSKGWWNSTYAAGRCIDMGGSYKFVRLNVAGSSYNYPFTTVTPICPAGKKIPKGTGYKFYPYPDAVGPQDGVACSGGCEMVANFDPLLGMSYALSGNLCPAHTGPDPADVPVPPPSESTTPDGGHSYCDTISGKCVTTSGGGASSPPAPPSSAAGPNGSTESSSTSTTNNGPTSSDTTTSSTSTTTSTTTTTNVGGGTGGGDGSGSGGTTGTGTSTTSGTSTSHTEAPASSSSTSSNSKCTTGVCDVGNADGNIGALYEGGTSSVESVYSDFKADVSSAPIIGTVSNFFVVGNLSGACPSWHIPGNKYWGEAGFDFDFFCSSGMLSILDLAGWIVLALGAFCAVRIAIY
jgi:hypothetical protein